VPSGGGGGGAAAGGAAAGGAAAEAPKEEPKEEGVCQSLFRYHLPMNANVVTAEKEESDEDMGFGLFD